MHAGFDVPGCTSSGGQMNSSIKDRPHAGASTKRYEPFLSESPSEVGPTKKRKLLSSSGIL